MEARYQTAPRPDATKIVPRDWIAQLVWSAGSLLPLCLPFGSRLGTGLRGGHRRIVAAILHLMTNLETLVEAWDEAYREFDIALDNFP